MTRGRAGSRLVGCLAAVLSLAACAGDGSGRGSGSDAARTPAPSAGKSDPTLTATPRPTTTPSPPRALVTHATVPQLRLDAATARALRSGEIRNWRRLGRPAAPLRVVSAVRAVERDPRAVGVVRLDEVGPTVHVAAVAGKDPVRDHPDAVSLTVVGDVMLSRGVDDPAAALQPMTRRLRSADITVGNLESTLSTNGSPTQGGDSFGGTPALLGPLRRAGFDLLSLANNHAGDYGTEALLETVRTLQRSPIEPFGAGADRAGASRPAVIERAGVQHAFVGFNAIGETPRATRTSPGALSVRMPPRTGPLVPADLRHVERVVRRAARTADVVVVLPHWGTQYTHRPEPIQREVSRALVRAGADLVVGAHPHWVQGVDLVRGVPVLHSLGNFVFDMDFLEQTMEGVALETTWWGAELKAMRLVPYRMDSTTFAPRTVRGAGILTDVWSTSTGPFGR